MDVTGNWKEKSIWISDNRRHFRNRFSDDSAALWRNLFFAVHGNQTKDFSLPLLLLVSTLGIGLAILMSRRAIQDATIFFLTENNQLWVMDARGLSNHWEKGFSVFPLAQWKPRPFCANRAGNLFFPIVQKKS